VTIEEAFGIVIKRLRRERGITQDVLSSASMLDRAFISKIENGKQQPSLITIVELAKALNVSISNIFFELQFILELNHPEAFKAESKMIDAKWFHDGDMMVKSFNDYSGSETLMVVDDESLIRQMLSDFLIEYGYKVITAKNGAEAIEKYKQDHIFDLIIMDVVMPVMDGITAFRELRKINEQAKVLLISGYTNQQLNNVEIAHCLQKPFSPLDLLKTIREILDGPK
jgi:CheY-like chemotaxis protein/DNA-binding XRE family transcriptional regulator